MTTEETLADGLTAHPIFSSVCDIKQREYDGLWAVWKKVEFPEFRTEDMVSNPVEWVIVSVKDTLEEAKKVRAEVIHDWRNRSSC